MGAEMPSVTSRPELALLARARTTAPIAERPLRVVEAVEALWPGARLDRSLDDMGKQPVRRRETYFRPAAGRSVDLFRPLPGHDIEARVALSTIAWDGPEDDHILIDAYMPMLPDAGRRAAELLRRIVPGSGLLTATIQSNSRDNWHLTWQYRSDDPSWSPPEGLPLLRSIWEHKGWMVPEHLFWMQWWSPARCAFVGFDPARDRGLFHLAEPLDGGWLLQLTDAPFHLPDAAHRSVLVRVLDRFPDIGGRTARARKPDCQGDDPPLRPDSWRDRRHIELAAPPLGPRDERALAILHRIDALGQPPLHVRMSRHTTERPIGEEIPLAERDALVLAATERGIPWMFAPSFLQRHVRGRLVRGPSPEYLLVEVIIGPIDDPSAVALLDDFAALLGAHWGRIVDHHDWQMTAPQVIGDGARTAPHPGLPALRPPSEIADPRVPAALGAVNYVSSETAALLGLPDPARDAGVIGSPRGARAGGWIWSLPYPYVIDRDTPRRIRELAAAYERFPMVGGRV